MSVTIYTALYYVHPTFGTIIDRACDAPILNVSNGNFTTLFSALGFETCDMGHMSVETLERGLDSFDPALAQRAGRDEGRYLEQGIDADRVARYVRSLRAILAFATERGAFIAWS